MSELEEGESIELVDGEVIVYSETFDEVNYEVDAETGELVAIRKFNPFTDPTFRARMKQRDKAKKEGIEQTRPKVKGLNIDPSGSLKLEMSVSIEVPELFKTTGAKKRFDKDKQRDLRSGRIKTR